jgi:hypothetical protein
MAMALLWLITRYGAKISTAPLASREARPFARDLGRVDAERANPRIWLTEHPTTGMKMD